ncbi:MAG: hypothetical protein JWN61_1787 [Pseudonocardiales bacterium]|nr:hypothetical protein [Pseudonocardiales bacterium]
MTGASGPPSGPVIGLPGDIPSGPRGNLPCKAMLGLLGEDHPLKPISNEVLKEALKSQRNDFIRSLLPGDIDSPETDKALVDLGDTLLVIGIIARAQRILQLWSSMDFTLEADQSLVHRPLSSGRAQAVNVTARSKIDEQLWQDDQDDWFTKSQAFQIFRDCLKSLLNVGTTDLTDVAEEMQKHHIRWELSESPSDFIEIQEARPPFSDQSYGETPVTRTGNHSTQAQLVIRIKPEERHYGDGPYRQHAIAVKATQATWKDVDFNVFAGFITKGYAVAGKAIDSIVARLVEAMAAKRRTATFVVEYCAPIRRLRFEIVEYTHADAGTGAVGMDAGAESTTVSRWTGVLEERIDGTFSGVATLVMKTWGGGKCVLALPAGPGTPPMMYSSSEQGGWHGHQAFSATAKLAEAEDEINKVSGPPAMTIRIAPQPGNPAYLVSDGDDPRRTNWDHVMSVDFANPFTYALICARDERSGENKYRKVDDPVEFMLGPVKITTTTTRWITTTWLPPDTPPAPTPPPGDGPDVSQAPN